MKTARIPMERKSAQKRAGVDVNKIRRTRIEELKTMINNEDYISEAVVKLARSLTTGLMKES